MNEERCCGAWLVETAGDWPSAAQEVTCHPFSRIQMEDFQSDVKSFPRFLSEQ